MYVLNQSQIKVSSRENLDNSLAYLRDLVGWDGPESSVYLLPSGVLNIEPSSTPVGAGVFLVRIPEGAIPWSIAEWFEEAAEQPCLFDVLSLLSDGSRLEAQDVADRFAAAQWQERFLEIRPWLSPADWYEPNKLEIIQAIKRGDRNELLIERFPNDNSVLGCRKEAAILWFSQLRNQSQEKTVGQD